MIITSLLDTDLYKFTMMQVVLHHFPGAQVEYRFKCRNPGVDLTPYVDEIREQIEALCTLRFAEDELAYLRGLRFIKSDFVDFLGLFQLNTKYIHWRPHARRNMVPLDPDRFSVNQDAMVKLMGWAGNMTLSNAFLQGVLTA